MGERAAVRTALPQGANRVHAYGGIVPRVSLVDEPEARGASFASWFYIPSNSTIEVRSCARLRTTPSDF